MSGCLSELVRCQAEQNPDALAILAPGRRPLSYGRLNRQVTEVIETLNASGLGRNDRVAMVLPEGPEAAVASIAIASGATCAPLNPFYRPIEFDFHLADLNCQGSVGAQRRYLSRGGRRKSPRHSAHRDGPDARCRSRHFHSAWSAPRTRESKVRIR